MDADAVTEQLRLTRPERHANAAHLTGRQRAVWILLRDAGTAGLELRELNHLAAYANPSAALARLVARGLAKRKRRGLYVATRLGERTL